MAESPTAPENPLARLNAEHDEAARSTTEPSKPPVPWSDLFFGAAIVVVVLAITLGLVIHQPERWLRTAAPPAPALPTHCAAPTEGEVTQILVRVVAGELVAQCSPPRVRK